MKKIVMIEDNPDNRLLVCAILKDYYQIFECDSSMSAMSCLRSMKPDGILLDISLPEIDGTEILQMIRAEAELKDTPVIALTAHAMKGDREKYLALGFNDYVTKPIMDETVLIETLRKYVPFP